MISLNRLLKLQAAFAALSLAYLFASLYRQQVTGEPLSAAAIWPSIAMFVVYSGCLLLPRFSMIQSYRLAMVLALQLGAGGVIGNVLLYMDSGLDQYASLTAFLVAVAINFFGTVLNIIALFGWFKRPEAVSRKHPGTAS